MWIQTWIHLAFLVYLWYDRHWKHEDTSNSTRWWKQLKTCCTALRQSAEKSKFGPSVCRRRRSYRGFMYLSKAIAVKFFSILIKTLLISVTNFYLSIFLRMMLFVLKNIYLGFLKRNKFIGCGNFQIRVYEWRIGRLFWAWIHSIPEF